MTGLIHPDRGAHHRARPLPARSRAPDAHHRLRHAVRRRTARRRPASTSSRPDCCSTGYREAEASQRAWKALERVSLTEAAHRKVAAYSKGMRQRVRLAQAIAHDPEVLVLDEPLNGLDPLVRAETIALFREFAAQGRHVILSSHVLQEVDVISDQVILIANGMIIAEGRDPQRARRDARASQPVSSSAAATPRASPPCCFEQDHITADQDPRRPPRPARDDAQPARVLARADADLARRPHRRERRRRPTRTWMRSTSI